MKSVLLIRHTKSDWSGMTSDFDRTIREDRKDDARVIAKAILAKGFKPDLITVSPAKRTLQTAILICEEWNYKYSDIIQDKSLYESSYREIANCIRHLDNKVSSAVIICHNPSITDFVNRYSDTRIDNVPTTGAVLISIETNDWQSLQTRGKLEWFLKPKELRK